MKWFRHQTNLRNNPVSKSIFRKFGHRGYVAYINLIELFCEHYEIDKTTIKMHIADWLSELRLGRNSRSTFETLLVHLKVNYHISESDFEVNLPQVLEIADEYTKKVRSKSGSTTSITEDNKEKEMRVDSITRMNHEAKVRKQAKEMINNLATAKSLSGSLPAQAIGSDVPW